MKRSIEEEKSKQRLHAPIVDSSDDTAQKLSRTGSVLAALCLICLFSWWIQHSRLEGDMSLPYLRPDIIVVHFLCMLPLAMFLSEFGCGVLKYRRFYQFLFLESLIFIGTAVMLLVIANSDNLGSTLSTYDAWESFIIRPVVALFVLLSLLLIMGNLSQSRQRKITKQPQLSVWILALVTALVIPVFYTESRVDEMMSQIEEYTGSGRVGDARQLTRQVLVLSPWVEINNQPAVDVALDLDRACFDIERSLAYLDQRPGTNEEQTYHKGRLQTILGQTDTAIRLLKPWSDNLSASPLTFQLLGNIYQHQENWLESERYFQRSLKAWQKLPDSEQQRGGIVSAWKGIAFAERKRGNYEAAENAYLSALSLDPQADQYFLLAQFYEDSQQTTKAREHAQQAMALNPARYETSGKKLITSLQQQHFGCLNVWRKSSPWFN